MADHLVAKAKLSPAKLSPAKSSLGVRKLKSAVVARRIQLIDRIRLNKPTRRQPSQKRTGIRTKPRVTPAQRREKQIAEESDQDILTVTEHVDIDGITERGRLLRQSTLKPASSAPKVVLEPDPEPINCTPTTKRIVRVVHRPREHSTLDVTVVPESKSIGIQVGSPSRELDKRRGVPPVVTPQQEPPLRSYWTHRVNLPYPPSQPNELQATLNGQYIQQPQQYQSYVPTVSAVQQHQQFMQGGPFMPAFIQAPSLIQAPPTRRQKRNFRKHQKYLQRQLR